MSTEVTTQPTTTFVKVSRDQMDEVTAAGTKQFAESLTALSSDELRTVVLRVQELRAQKGKNTYLTFPVRADKQQAAGIVYLKALAAFAANVKAEQARRTMASMLAPKAEAVAA